ncbi:MAG: hypothetical protein LBD94_00495 [Rickettsiales bacterium]|jgi:hypothetical protein|nr:hypothetical protein [Rickettsiales bacterium]
MKKVIPFFMSVVVVCSTNAAQYGREITQMMSLQATADAISGTNIALPVRVLDIELENEIRAGNSSTTIADLEACQMIYMNGSFLWDVPTGGVSADLTKPTCVAEVHMKNAPDGQNPGGANDKVLAVAYVPAGSSIKCNISHFPEVGYLPDAGTVIFPADKEPTPEEVEAIMNKEQKQNAGLKTAGAAVAGGLLTFFLATKEDDGMAKRLATSGAVAAGTGGLTYASTQMGKVAGDTLMAAGVNAGAGAMMGNMGAGMGSSDSILVIKDCEIGTSEAKEKTKCLWGYVTTGGSPYPAGGGPGYKGDLYYNKIKNETAILEMDGQAEPGKKLKSEYGLSKIKVNDTDVSSIDSAKWGELVKATDGAICLSQEGGNYVIQSVGPNANCAPEYMWLKAAANTGGTRRLAMIVNYKDKFFGTKESNYTKEGLNDSMVVGRNADGTQNSDKEYYDGKNPDNPSFTLDNFTPLTIDSSDGDVIDFGNKARIKGTLIGAGSGAAVGGVAAYSGAKAEVEERYWVEFENYEGSLKNFYCITGKRYLGRYNDEIIIPMMK